MRFIIDAKLPPALATWLRRRGHDAVAVRDMDLRDADDRMIWRRAAEHGAIVVTKDEDFAQLSLAADIGPSVLWVRIGNVSNQALVATFERIWPEVEVHLASGDKIVEVR